MKDPKFRVLLTTGPDNCVKVMLKGIDCFFSRDRYSIDKDTFDRALKEIGWHIDTEDDCVCTNGKESFDFGDYEIFTEEDFYFLNSNHPPMQRTGKKGFNKRNLYEHDIVFYEEAEEDGDRRFYLIIVWIPEWCMFASLRMDEYHAYLKKGVKALDEPLFWTYNLEKSEHFHYAGNLYENPELLNK